MKKPAVRAFSGKREKGKGRGKGEEMSGQEWERTSAKSPAAFVLLVALAVAVGTIPMYAHWDPGDDYKMHYPQLPDPEGWDVYAEYQDGGYPGWPWWGCTKRGLADDWQCNESGYVEDIHFWGSWKGDVVGYTGNIYVAIFEDDSGTPGDILWDNVFEVGDYQVREYGGGDQGWFDPYTGYYKESDHDNIYQYNIPFIEDPFYQEEGTIYWLGLSMNFVGCEWGWKTSQDHFGADAAYLLNFQYPPAWWDWRELIDPVTSQSLDLAFVITPEPSTVCLLGLGALALLRKRKA